MDRFDFCNYPDGAYMHKCDDGEYCLYDDYEAMEKRAIAAESKLAEIEKQEPVAHRWVDINRDGEPYYEYEDGEPFVGKEIDCKYKYRRLYELPVRPSPAVIVPESVAKVIAIEFLRAWNRTSCAQSSDFFDGWIVTDEARRLLSTPTPPSAERGHDCCCGETEQSWRLCKLHCSGQPDSASVEPVYFWKEIGETDWIECRKQWFDKCSESPEHDTKLLYTAPPTKPQRITEQDAREIAQRAIAFMNGTMKDALYHAEKFIAEPETKSLIAKLNEHREPDYKAQRDEVIAAGKELLKNQKAFGMQGDSMTKLEKAIAKASASTDSEV